MVKAYLKYELATSFGVVTGSTTGVVSLPPVGFASVVAAPTVDAVRIWNLRSATTLATLANSSTRRAGQVTCIAIASNNDTLAAGYADGSIRIWSVDQALRTDRDAALAARDERNNFFAEQEPLVTLNGHRSAVSSLSFLLTREDLSSDVYHASSKSGKDVSSLKRRISESNASQSQGFANNSSRLASGSNDGDLILWDLDGEVGLFRLMAHSDMVTSVKLLDHIPAPILISASKDGLVRVHNIESQHCVQTLVGHHAEVWAMDVDPSHSILVTGSVDADIRAFRLRLDSGFGSADSDKSEANTELSSADGSSTADEDMNDYEVLKEVGAIRRTHSASRVVDLAIRRVEDQVFMALCAADKSAELFRIRGLREAEHHRKRRCKRYLEKERKGEENCHHNPRTENSPDGGDRLDIAIAKDFLTSLRSFKTPARARTISFALLGTARSSAILTDVHLIFQLHNNALELHCMKVASKARKRYLKKERRRSTAHAAATNMLSGNQSPTEADELRQESEAGAIEFVSAVDSEGHRADVRSICISPDDQSLLSVSRKSAKLWNMATGRCIRTMSTSGHSLCARFVGPSARFAAVGAKEGIFEIFDLGSGERRAAVEEAHSDAIWSMSLDGYVYDSTTLITGGADKLVQFWDISAAVTHDVGENTKLSMVRSLELRDEVLCVCVAHNRDRPILMVSLMDSTIQGFDLNTLEPYMNFYGHKMPVLSMDISSDGLLLASGSADKTIKIWGMDFGDCRRSLRAHEESIMAVAFQPETHYLFSGSRDGTLKYWDCDKFELVTALEGQSGEVWAVAVGEDGEFVASASRDRLIRIWRRSDEQIFLEEEQDKRMDEIFESTLIDEDNKEASKARGNVGTLLDDPKKGDSHPAGKRSMETIKAGERLLAALELAESEKLRLDNDPQEAPNPLLLGLSAEGYVLRTLEEIRVAELEDALNLLPLHSACFLMRHCNSLLQLSHAPSRLIVELLCRCVLYIFKTHHNQIVAGALDREVVSNLTTVMHCRLRDLRARVGFTASALSFWQAELADMHDMPFQDAAVRADNRQRELERRQKRIKM